MVFGEEAFFVSQKLMLPTVGVVDDGDEESPEINLDPGEKLGERGFIEVAVVVEGELARVQVDLDTNSAIDGSTNGRKV